MERKNKIGHLLYVDHELKQNRLSVGKKHTFLSAVILFGMFFLIGHTGNCHLWDGPVFDSMDDYFELHHHSLALNVSQVLGYEHPLLKLHAQCDEDGHIHTSNPKHHSNLETLMDDMDHKHHYYLAIALIAWLFLASTTCLKLLFLVDKTWEMMLEVLIVLTLISTFVQFIGFVSLFFVLYHFWYWGSILLIVGQICLSMVELASFLALWNIRQKLNYMRHQHFKIKATIHAHSKHIAENSENETLKRNIKELISGQRDLNQFLAGFIYRLRGNFLALSSGLSNKEKFD